MIRGMDPAPQPGPVAFVALDGRAAAAALPDARAMLREAEAVTLVLPAGHPAVAPDAPRFVQITLRVHSALDGIGLTAAVAGALADAGIPCNVIAGAHHDHVFVPEADADRALAALRARAAAG